MIYQVINCYKRRDSTHKNIVGQVNYSTQHKNVWQKETLKRNLWKVLVESRIQLVRHWHSQAADGTATDRFKGIVTQMVKTGRTGRLPGTNYMTIGLVCNWPVVGRFSRWLQYPWKSCQRVDTGIQETEKVGDLTITPLAFHPSDNSTGTFWSVDNETQTV